MFDKNRISTALGHNWYLGVCEHVPRSGKVGFEATTHGIAAKRSTVRDGDCVEFGACRQNLATHALRHRFDPPCDARVSVYLTRRRPDSIPIPCNEAW